jgi:hypothetical protein
MVSAAYSSLPYIQCYFCIKKFQSAVTKFDRREGGVSCQEEKVPERCFSLHPYEKKLSEGHFCMLHHKSTPAYVEPQSLLLCSQKPATVLLS